MGCAIFLRSSSAVIRPSRRPPTDAYAPGEQVRVFLASERVEQIIKPSYFSWTKSSDSSGLNLSAAHSRQKAKPLSSNRLRS